MKNRNYYELRRLALTDIDNMVKENKSEFEIEYAISTRYGFGRRLISERIELLNKMIESVTSK